MNYSFLDLAKDVMLEKKQPLSHVEIWQGAVELELDKKVGTTGKTPWQSIGAQLYTNIKNNDDSIFYQYSKRPAKFYLKQFQDDINSYTTKTDSEAKVSITSKYNERDLHILLVSFVQSNPHFKCHSKTIYHEKSKKAIKGKNEWLHPDIVGVYYPFEDYSSEVIELFKTLETTQFKLFSFEMKKELDFSTLREYYFQAVSNSSWANEGYLVTLKISEDDEFLEELRRLNNAFGIGVIKLNAENYDQSEIVFQARYNDNIDWDTVERLADENEDFKEFLLGISKSGKIKDVVGQYDNCFRDEAIAVKYMKDKGIL